MEKITVVTHNGVFHADEVFACAAIKMAHSDMNVEIIRSRNPAIFEKADFVVDVGGKYDGKKYFDHHQRDFDLKRENSIKFSSFGLIWNLLGEEICADEEVAQMVDKTLVQFIDSVDNGQAEKLKNVFTVSNIISGFNQNWYEDGDEEGQMMEFLEAVEVAERILYNAVKSVRGVVMAKEELKKAEKLFDGKVLLLERFCPWQQYVANNPDLLFVIFLDPTGSWRVQTVPETPYSFKSKKSLPESWAGLEGENLQKVTGVEDAVFCHAGRFIAGAKSKEGAIKMAELALSS